MLSLTDQTLICPRFYEEDLFILKPAQSKKSKVIHFDSGNIVGMLDGCWFEVFEWKGQHYLTSKSELFKIEKSSSSQFSLSCRHTEMPQNCQECSICSSKESYIWPHGFLERRVRLFGSYIVLYESQEPTSWKFSDNLFSFDDYKKPLRWCWVSHY